MHTHPRRKARKRPDLTPKIDNPAQLALFLDLDGTLLDIAGVPSEVTTPDGLTSTLARLQRVLGGAVAILTGRRIDEVDRLLAPLRLPSAGVHGNELRFEVGGDIEVASDQVPSYLVEAVDQLAGEFPGVFVEHKGIALTVHYRAVPEVEPDLEERLRGVLREQTSRLVLSQGRRVIELVPPCMTKGTALHRFMQIPGFRERRPIMIGDDLPDEPALDTAAELGGQGLRVKGEHFQSGGTQFNSPAHVRGWLQDFADRYDR